MKFNLPNPMKKENISSSLKIVAAYLTAGVLWILFTEGILPILFPDPEYFSTAENYSGWVFIIVSAIILYTLLRRNRKIQSTVESALRDQESQYRTIIEHASDGIVIVTNMGIILEANQQFTTMLEYSQNEIRKLRLNDLTPDFPQFTDWGLESPALGPMQTLERTFLRKDGTPLIVELSMKALPNSLIMGIARNISGRKLIQETLVRSEQKFRLLIENSMDAIAMYSPNGAVIFQSPAVTRILGYSQDELIGKNALDYVFEEDKKSADEAFQKVLAEPGKIITFEIRSICKDKNLKWLEVNITNRLHEAGIEAIIGNYRDITERKAAGQAIFEAEERYRMLVEKLPAVVFMDKFNDAQSTYYISPRIKDLLGYSPEEWETGDNMWESSLHPDDRERVLAEDNRTNQTGEPFRIEYRLLHRDGHYVWIKEEASIVKQADGSPQFWHGILMDITEQKQAQEALQRRDAILKAVGFSAEQFLKASNWEECIEQVLEQLGRTTDASRVYLFKRNSTEEKSSTVSQIYEWCNVDIEPQLSNTSLQTINMLQAGYSRWLESFDRGHPIIGNVADFPAEEQKNLQEQDIRSLVCIPIQTGDDWWGYIGFDECNYERAWSAVEIEALRTAASTLGTAIKKQQSEVLVQSSEASYRGLFNSVKDAIYIYDRDGKILDANIGAEKMYGYPGEDFIGKTPEFLSAPGRNDMEKIAQALEDALNGEPRELEYWGRRNNGEIFPMEVRLFNGSYFGQAVVIAVAQDITARKSAEDALQKQLRELSVLHAAALTESTAKDTDTLIQQITNIISDTLYSDNCGILLLNENQDTLIPHYSFRGSDMGNIGRKLPVAEGVSGMVVSTRRSIRIDDVSAAPYYVEVSQNTRSELCVPIISGSKVLGVLNVESEMPGAFTERDERLLNTIAGGLANAMERIQLFELEKKRREQAENLREATLTLTSIFELAKLYESIFSSLSSLINYDSASIELLDRDYFEIVAGWNIPKALIGKRYYSDPEKWGGIEALRQPVIINDAQLDERFFKFEETSYIRGWMGVPLLARDKVIGFLNIDSRTPGAFHNESASIIQTFANQAAIAIENVRLFELEQQRRKEAEILRHATASLANTLDINGLYETILDWLEKLAPFDSASIMLKQENSIKLAAHRNLPEHFQIGQEFPITEKWKHIEENRKPLIIRDAQTDKIFESWEGSEYIHGWMSVAMFAQDTLIGFINLDSNSIGTYTEEYATPIQTFANQSAMAIDKARLFDLEKRRRESSETLRQVTTTLTKQLDLPSLQSSILELLYQITPYDSASILEIEGEQVRITAARGLPNPETALNQAYPLSNALCKIMNATGKALIIDDCRNDPRFEKWGGANHVRGWMGVPLTSRGQVIGYITIDSLTPNAFTQNDAVAAQTFAQQAATSLENVRLYTETRQRLEELELVSRVSYALRAARDTQEMLPILLDEIRTSTKTDAVAIWLYHQDSDLLIPYAASGKLSKLPRATMHPNEGIIGTVYMNGSPRISPEYANDAFALPENAEFFGQEGWGGIAVPIRTMSETIGVISVAVQAPRKIEAHHQRLITTVAEIAGNAIHRSNLFTTSEEQIRRLTTLREMDTAITSSLDLHITLNIITDHLISRMGISAAAILVFNSDSQMLNYYALSGFKNPNIGRMSLSIGNGLAGQILLNRRATYIKDLKNEASTGHTALLSDEKFKSYYAIPLFSKGITKGILETYFEESFTPSPDWVEFLQTLAGQATIAIDNAQLFENLQRTNQEISLAYDTTLEGWGKALELRDKETRGHTERVTNLTLELARQIGISESELIHIRRGALLHDIGKMGVPDNILHKPGTLTAKETTEMRNHPKYAFDLLAPISYLRPSLDIPYCHHEWWDGSGYPRGLKGEEIPLSARIFAVIDVWDALLSDRPYRKAWSEKAVLKYINDLTGKQFDPHVVAAFQKLLASESKFIRFNYPPKEKERTKTRKSSKPK
ncbi:MAG: GAF domain-containing protein [Anaerolineales bacterium]|nr:GAF domain-containing protein [Anaerolineales bacterium]